MRQPWRFATWLAGMYYPQGQILLGMIIVLADMSVFDCLWKKTISPKNPAWNRGLIDFIRAIPPVHPHQVPS